MKLSRSLIDALLFTAAGIALVFGVYIISNSDRFTPAIAKEPIAPVSYCAVELTYRVEESPGKLSESSICIESSFYWEEHIGKVRAQFDNQS